MSKDNYIVVIRSVKLCFISSKMFPTMFKLKEIYKFIHGITGFNFVTCHMNSRRGGRKLANATICNGNKTLIITSLVTLLVEFVRWIFICSGCCVMLKQIPWCHAAATLCQQTTSFCCHCFDWQTSSSRNYIMCLKEKTAFLFICTSSVIRVEKVTLEM